MRARIKSAHNRSHYRNHYRNRYRNHYRNRNRNHCRDYYRDHSREHCFLLADAWSTEQKDHEGNRLLTMDEIENG